MAGLCCLGLLCVIMSWIFLAIGFTSSCIVFNWECRYTHDDDFTQYWMFITWMRVGLVTIIDTRPFLLMNYKTVSHANLITIYWWRTDIAGDNINQKGSCKICFFSSPSLLSATRPPIDTELYLFMWVLIGGRLQRKYDISNRQKLTMNEWAS